MNALTELLHSMDPEKALAQLATYIRELLPHLDEEKRTRFIVSMIGDSDGGRTAGLVDL